MGDIKKTLCEENMGGECCQYEDSAKHYLFLTSTNCKIIKKKNPSICKFQKAD